MERNRRALWLGLGAFGTAVAALAIWRTRAHSEKRSSEDRRWIPKRLRIRRREVQIGEPAIRVEQRPAVKIGTPEIKTGTPDVIAGAALVRTPD